MSTLAPPCLYYMVDLGLGLENHHCFLTQYTPPWAQLQHKFIRLRSSCISLVYSHCSPLSKICRHQKLFQIALFFIINPSLECLAITMAANQVLEPSYNSSCSMHHYQCDSRHDLVPPFATSFLLPPFLGRLQNSK